MTRTYKPEIALALLAQSVFLVLPFAAVIVYLWFLIGSDVAIGIPLLLAFTVIMLLPSAIILSFHKYEITSENVKQYYGVIARKQVTIVRKQIQDVGVYQGLLDRIFGLANVDIKTMSAAHKLLRLKISDANQIRDELYKKETGKTPFKIAALRKTIAYILVGAVVSYVFLSSWLIVLLFVLGVVIYNHATSYKIGEHGISKGYLFLAKTQVEIPYKKIQNLIIRRGPIDQILGLSNLTIETGGYLDANEQKHEYIIPCLRKDDALELNDLIFQKCELKTAITSFRKHYPLSKLKPLKKAFRYTWYFAILSAIAGVGFEVDSVITLTVIALFFVFQLIYQVIYYLTYDYYDNKQLLQLQKGVVLRTTLTIPYEKIQHIMIDQDIFDRIFCLYDVHGSSAGTTKMELHIDGVRKETTEELRRLLLGRTII